MAKGHRPRRGSLAFSPRKRAQSHIPRFRSWPESSAEPKLQGFAGYKVGMTHVIMIDDTKNSLTEGTEISVPVTVIETPAIRVAAIRAYGENTHGEKALAEAWTNVLDSDLDRRIKAPKNHDVNAALEKIGSLVENGKATDIRVITYTLPSTLTGVPKKVPDVMETGVSGSDVGAKFEFAKTILGTMVDVSDVFDNGGIIDVAAITTGHGTQGPVKRWGINLMKNKHSRQGSLRQVGTLGPWTPAHVSWRVPAMGQMGYHQRTEYNKRILKMSSDAEEINPAGGFTNYGVVRGNYILIKGSVPGPSKRLIRLREPTRSKVSSMGEPQIVHISTQSMQG
ncbi:50S ribosomal protein L3 [Methanococcoides methylutens]|uniref:Large ribosomal subunit protein uL3 n=1 Tax=Methanococcoides methylutens TaxID=2226 RepID=A0A099T3U2_METMT|nr:MULTISPECIES: 50S ribosomal protein L3 [Methanococcoides]KGK99519.1 50S ribosomal protein L3 [Methanococcoides methylutens]UGV40935.1 50S ribosomal protein L3 [Methanococcoides orientis]